MPREFDAECCILLANFAGMVVQDVERSEKLDAQVQRNLITLGESEELIQAIDRSDDAYILCNPHDNGWCAPTHPMANHPTAYPPTCPAILTVWSKLGDYCT